jgi:hypothetical protein
VIRNQHDRTHDHTGTLDLSDVVVDAINVNLTSFAAGTALSTVLASFASSLPPRKTFTADALIKKVMGWPYLPFPFTADAVIGTPSAIHWYGFVPTIAVIKRLDISHSFTADAYISYGFKANAMILKPRSGSFHADAKIT